MELHSGIFILFRVPADQKIKGHWKIGVQTGFLSSQLLEKHQLPLADDRLAPKVQEIASVVKT